MPRETLSDMVSFGTISVMELSVIDIAAATGTTPQYVRRAIAAGDLKALRRVGRTILVDDLAAQAWDRGRGQGRRWSNEVRRAAFDLLETAATEWLSSSERSRLRARLRTATARQLAHLSGGLSGSWGRYRRSSHDSQLVDLVPIGLSPSEFMTVGLTAGDTPVALFATRSLEDFELDNDVVLDASGELGIVERNEVGGRTRAMLDTYLLGGARESFAAGSRLEEIARAL